MMLSVCNNGFQLSYVWGNGLFVSSIQIEFLWGKFLFFDRWEMCESDWMVLVFEIVDKLGVDFEFYDG